jgi:hypothetical protein
MSYTAGTTTTIYRRQNPVHLTTWRVFKNEILRTIFGHKEENNQMRNYVSINFIGNVHPSPNVV